jgi:predicted deacylase
LETVILPACDAAIDLHSGGKAAWFLPCTMARCDQQGQLSTDNIELANAFDLPHLLLMNAHNDNRTVNAAACRQNVTMIAVELGGGGKITPSVLAATEHGVENCLKHLGLIEQSPKYMNRPISVEVNHDKQSIYALQGGLFEPTFSAGDSVDQRQIAGYIYSLNDLDQPVSTVRFTASGIALMCCKRGLVERGELLSIVAEETNDHTCQNHH